MKVGVIMRYRVNVVKRNKVINTLDYSDLSQLKTDLVSIMSNYGNATTLEVVENNRGLYEYYMTGDKIFKRQFITDLGKWGV